MAAQKSQINKTSKIYVGLSRPVSQSGPIIVNFGTGDGTQQQSHHHPRLDEVEVYKPNKK